MAIRKRLAVSAPRTVNEDSAIRVAFRAGVAQLKREADFDPKGTGDEELRKLYAQIAFLEEALRHGGILSIVKK